MNSLSQQSPIVRREPSHRRLVVPTEDDVRYEAKMALDEEAAMVEGLPEDHLVAATARNLAGRDFEVNLEVIRSVIINSDDFIRLFQADGPIADAESITSVTDVFETVHSRGNTRSLPLEKILISAADSTHLDGMSDILHNVREMIRYGYLIEVRPLEYVLVDNLIYQPVSKQPVNKQPVSKRPSVDVATATGTAGQDRMPYRSPYAEYMRDEIARVKKAQPTLSDVQAFEVAASHWKAVKTASRTTRQPN